MRGVLLLTGSPRSSSPGEEALLSAVAAELSMAVMMRERLDEAAEGRRRAELVMAISSDMGSHLDLPRVLTHLVDRATEVFGADRGGIFTSQPDGSFRVRATQNLSTEYRDFVEHASTLPVANLAIEQQRIISISDFPDDPEAGELKQALVQEGINTVTVAPLMADGEALGVLSLYHSNKFEWQPEQLTLLEQLARQASSVLRNAQNYSQMATWAAQLQSIQQLGSRLTRLSTVAEIGHAICAELNQLIDFHNVRVYRVDGENCVPVAWRGEVGEYRGEEGSQLRVKVGEGVTGWVARYGLAQNVGDAAKDRRAKTIPGTDDDLDESLLLAPMLYDDEAIGVIVLAKLGLNKFSSDDLRLLEIYASIAAQAMSNADSTERLRAQSEALTRQLNSQRELLRVTESILSTLDTQALLEEIAQRLNTLVKVDNICVDLHDPRAGLLRPIFARGVQALEYLAMTIPDNEGVGGYVLKTGEAQLVQDQLNDKRVVHFAGLGPEAGAMIVAPLRGADRTRGVLTIERLGTEATFSDEEFELVKLFAGHVSIALQNAEAHRAVELRAETDTLTGLYNHGALMEHLDQMVSKDVRFTMLMVDLDHFKRYNDRFGHQAGNVMLQHIASLIRSSCRDSDQVFRYGGDEFALLLPSTSLAGARTVAEKVQAAVRSVNDGRALPVTLTCSIGMAVFPIDGKDGQSIILAADRACYAGKRAGRARIATAAEGLELAQEFQPTEPTPVDPLVPEPTYSVA
jgi:diguanylate cyclase (GGDEF)-like protein